MNELNYIEYQRLIYAVSAVFSSCKLINKISTSFGKYANNIRQLQVQLIYFSTFTFYIIFISIVLHLHLDACFQGLPQ